MNRFNTVLFDLDGTLTDSGEGIKNAFTYAFTALGINPPTPEMLNSFIGPPLIWAFETRYGLDRNTALAAINYYREYYRDRGLYENELYPDIHSLLSRLRGAGIRLAVATSKADTFADIILKRFELKKYFDFIAGSQLDGGRVNKVDVIKYALELSDCPEPSGVVMVGDREHDITGARLAGLSSIGVLWGYGSRDELEAAGADYIARDADELVNYLI